MPDKRKRDDENEHPSDSKAVKKRRNHGFKVGPDNLPDGAYKRKNQKLKRDLIDRARLQKSYAKLKRQIQEEEPQAKESHTLPQPASASLDEEPDDVGPHPDRQALIEEQAENPIEPADERRGGEEGGFQRRRRKPPRTVPFKKEVERAQKRREEFEERKASRLAAEEERQRKMEERERFRRAMAKARRGGPDGKRKLGRESNVLLEKVKRMVGVGN